MASHGSLDALQQNIAWLQAEQEHKQELLKLEFSDTYESLKPGALLKDAMDDITSSPAAVEGILIPLLGLGAGYLAKRIVVGKSDNPNRLAVGEAVQVSIANVVAQHPDEIRIAGTFLLRFILGGKKKQRKSHDA